LLALTRRGWHARPKQELALDAVRTVTVASQAGGPPEIDIKKYAKVEKLPGGSLEDCRVLSGVMFQKVRGFICHLSSADGERHGERHAAGHCLEA
jgi:hypothetical protein